MYRLNKKSFVIRIQTLVWLIFLLKLCLSTEFESESKITNNLFERQKLNLTEDEITIVNGTENTEIIIVKLDSEELSGLTKENDTLKTESNSASATATAQGSSNSYTNSNEDIMKEYFGESSGYTTGKGASGPLYVCGYVGGEDGENPGESHDPKPDVRLEREQHNNNAKPDSQLYNNHNYGHKPFVPSPEIVHNVIQYDTYNTDYYEEEVPENENFYHYHHYDHSYESQSEEHSGESDGCGGWKVVYHPMSRIYPFKYKNAQYY